MKLSSLIRALKIAAVIGSVDRDVTGFTIDSRTVKPGNMFVALNEPELADRREFVKDAISAGATSVLVDRPLDDSQAHAGVTQIVVPDIQVASAVLASEFYGRPASKLSLIGVTGTKGKTTTAYLIYEILRQTGTIPGLIGTVAVHYGDRVEGSQNTTPHSVELQRILAKMVESGVTTVSMEVSSHALRLHRVSGLRFDVGVFTNIGGDHMNFHQTMEDYVQAKSMLIASVINGCNVVNIDDERGGFMRSSSSSECITYGLSEKALLRAVDVETSLAGSTYRIVSPFGNASVETPLAGRFNVYNELAAIGAAIARGVSLTDAIGVLRTVRGVPGRLESVDTGDLGFRILVDYAHTAESMENVLSTLRALNPRKLITVFGCGGDRDRTRRPKMARVAAKYSDRVFITSDNPRTEDPARIIEDIEQGLIEERVSKTRYTVIENRGEAITEAVKEACAGDIVAILGKGHEDYQILGHTKIHFDDREVARKAVLDRIG